MKELLVLLRAMQLYAQNAHHLCKGQTFQQDHAFFGDVYEAIGDDYDQVAERIIGLYGEEPFFLQPLMSAVVTKLASAPSVGVQSNKIYYEYLLGMEKQICELVDVIVKNNPTKGNEQLITELCNKSEARQYLIKRRIL